MQQIDIDIALVLLRDHSEYLSKKTRAISAVKGRKIITKQEQWDAHKWIRLEMATRSAIYGQADKIISNQKLYHDLT